MNDAEFRRRAHELLLGQVRAADRTSTSDPATYRRIDERRALIAAGPEDTTEDEVRQCCAVHCKAQAVAGGDYCEECGAEETPR
jgi:hypothetical protein